MRRQLGVRTGLSTAGLHWKGVALVAAFCLFNALRRSINSPLLLEAPADWLVDVADLTLTGMFIAVPVMVAVVVAYNKLDVGGWRLLGAMLLVVAVASAAGTALLIAWESEVSGSSDGPIADPGQFVAFFTATWPRYLLLGALFAAAYGYFRRKGEGAAALQQAESERLQLEQRMTEARLTVLRAQIEPHFLFNTLANVKRLYVADPTAARAMLDNLMRYLGVALPQMRQTESTVHREMTLARAYLEIQKIRMGRRLEFTTSLPLPLRDANVPPMMLLTLVENAIKHGLNPLPQGGLIRIAVSESGANLSISVADSGRGFTKASGSGTGVSNIRERLEAVYGPAASLIFTINEPRGVTATITLPKTGGLQRADLQ